MALYGNTTLSSNTAGRVLRLSGPIGKSVDATITLQGAGDFDLTGNISDKGYTLTPIIARAFNGVQQDLASATVITNDINGTTG